MAALKKEQVEQKMQQLKQLSGEISALTKELAEAGVIKLSEEDLEKVAGGRNKENPQAQISQRYLDQLATAQRLIKEADEERQRKWGSKLK